LLKEFEQLPLSSGGVDLFVEISEHLISEVYRVMLRTRNISQQRGYFNDPTAVLEFVK